MKILFVDDNRTILDLLVSMLQDYTARWDMVFEYDSTRAAEAIKKNSFDVIITDLVMENVDGIGIVKIAKEVNPVTEVVVLTAYASVDTAIDAMKNGAFDYMSKPVMQPELIAKLEHLETLVTSYKEAEEKRHLKENIEEQACIRIGEIEIDLERLIEMVDAITSAAVTIKSDAALLEQVEKIFEGTVL